jgi:hypothetical protein
VAAKRRRQKRGDLSVSAWQDGNLSRLLRQGGTDLFIVCHRAANFLPKGSRGTPSNIHFFQKPIVIAWRGHTLTHLSQCIHSKEFGES